MFALAGFVVVMTAATAQAVGDTGGCDPRIDGVHPSFMEQDRALPIAKHEVVEVTGRVPSEFRSPSVTTTTHIDVDFVTGVFGASSSDHPGTGPAVRDSVQADDYLKYGVGLYHVWAVVKGDGWNCLADGYVRLEDGSPLSHPVGEVAGGLTVVSATGIFISARWRRYYGYVAADYEDPPAVVKADAEVRANEDAKRGSALVTDAPTAAGAAVGCILLLLVATFAAHSLDTAVKAAAVPAVRRRAGRYWVRGHVVPATISGLFLGIGVTVLLQQYAYWPLTVVTAFVFPPVVAIIAGLWAHIGTPMKPVKAEAASPSS